MADDTPTTVAEALDFFAEQSAEAAEQFEEENDADVPEHGEALVVDEAANLMKTVTSVDMALAVAGEDDEPNREAMDEDLTEAAVDLFEALAVLAYERDIDVAGAIDERIEFVEQYLAFEEAMEAAETPEEQTEAVDEYMTDELADEMGVEMGPSVGDSVDADDYEHGEIDRSFQ
jgi:hypothetical protein